MPEQQQPRWLSAEMITAISAVVIGVGAVAVSLYETALIRQQLKGTAWPNVEIGYSYNDKGFRFLVMNTGVGPARIRSAEVTVDGVPVRDWNEFLSRLELDIGNPTVSYFGRRVLPPDTMLDVLILGSGEPAEELHASRERIEISICYCSVHDDCWNTNLGEAASPVEACVQDADRQFRN